MNNYVFIVEGEGRGHLTQCISLYQKLKSKGGNINAIIIGKNKNRQIPEFFYKKIGKEVEIIELETPSFSFDNENKGIDITKTVFFNLSKSKKWINSVLKIRKTIEKYNPDKIINFYNILGGIFNLFYNHKNFYCIGHQYMIEHPEFKFPDDSKKRDINLFKSVNKLTSFNCKRKIALSFYKTYNYKDIIISPPLIREEVLNLKTSNEEFILSYIVNSGYKNDLIKWKKRNNEKLYIFGDKNDEIHGKEIEEDIFWNKIDDVQFLDKLSKCYYYISTSGFESICEALYLDKNLIAIPVENHFEQYCNSKDLEKIGLKSFKNFDEIQLIENKPNFDFKKWANSDFYWDI
jgi:uncharacterized protein (TIGR00661 family)